MLADKWPYSEEELLGYSISEHLWLNSPEKARTDITDGIDPAIVQQLTRLSPVFLGIEP